MSTPTIDAVVPLRWVDCCTDDGQPKFLLQTRTLWDITFDQAAASPAIRRVIAAYDDERFMRRLAVAVSKIVPLRRPSELSANGVTTIDVLIAVARQLKERAEAPDYLALMEITHPLRPRTIVTEIARVLNTDDPDSLITCRPVHYNFWRRDAEGAMDRIAGKGDAPGITMFQELVGICSLFRVDTLLGDNPFGQRIDMVPIDRFWSTVDIRDPDGLWLAERYLERVGAKL